MGVCSRCDLRSGVYNIADQSVYPFDPNRCTISGRVTDGAGNGVAGVTVSAGARSATTDANGFYAISGLSSGVYALRAEKPGCLIEPAQRAVTLPPDQDAQDFTAICLTERAFLPLVIR